MAFATETFSDVNPLVRFSFRPNATRGVIAGAAFVAVGTVALSWMVATVVTMQTMGMSLGSGSAISERGSLGAKGIALLTSYEKQRHSETSFSFSLKGGRVWKNPITDMGRFAAAPLESAAVAGTSALSAAALVEHFRHVASVHGSGASAKTDRIVAQADPAAERRKQQAAPGAASSAQPSGEIPGALATGQFESTPRAADKQQTGLALASSAASTDENRGIVAPNAAPAKPLIAIADGLTSLGKAAAPALTSLSVASIALPASNPPAPPMHFMPAEAMEAPSMSPAASSIEDKVASPTPADIPQANTGTAITVPVPTSTPLERSPASTDSGDQANEAELVSIEPDLEQDLPDDVPLPMTRPRGLPKIISEGPAGQSKPSTGQALAYARPENPLRDDQEDEGPRPLFGAPGRVAIYDISAHTVYLPSGERLEAHSGLGGMLDNPRYVNQKNRGPTPPHTYDLVMREKLFHGVAAIRLLPVDASKIYGRDGLLAHTYMLGPRGDSNGCISFKDYRRFLAAFRRGDFKRLVVVPRLSSRPTRFAFAGHAA